MHKAFKATRTEPKLMLGPAGLESGVGGPPYGL